MLTCLRASSLTKPKQGRWKPGVKGGNCCPPPKFCVGKKHIQNLLLRKPLNYYVPPPPRFSALPTSLLLPILNIHMTRRKNRKIAVEISWFHGYKLVVTMQGRRKVLKSGLAIIQKKVFWWSRFGRNLEGQLSPDQAATDPHAPRFRRSSHE